MVGDKSLYRSRPYYLRKCKSVRATSIESLSDELLLDILARLSDDPDYLYNKARAVCRRWCHLIRSRDFIKTQLQRSASGLLFSMVDRVTIVTATQGVIETREIPGDGAYLKSVCSCNGLILLQRGRSDPMHIANPSTRQKLILPSFSCEGLAEMIPMACGIGYAADSMVYKVVVPYLNVKGKVFLGILSVGIDKSWRRVGVEHFSGLAEHLFKRFLTVSCNTEGFITWSNCVGGGLYLTLDVETEILTLHPGPLPKAYLTHHKRPFYLSTGRSLSLLVVEQRATYLMEFWEMKEESGEWRKVVDDIKLGNHARWLLENGGSGYLTPLGWVRFPEILALYFRKQDSTASDYFFLNLNTQQISSMELLRMDAFELGEFHFAQLHKKTLTWIT